MLSSLRAFRLLRHGTRCSDGEQGGDTGKVALSDLSHTVYAKYVRGFTGQLTNGTVTRRCLLYPRVLPPFGLEILFSCVLRLQIRTTSLSRLVHHLLFIELLGLSSP